MDYYKALGVNKNASKSEIKDAFRKLALKYHPDKQQHSDQSSKLARDNALVRFKQLSEAYQVLVDDQKRAHYNRQTSSSSASFRGSGGYGYYNHNNNSTWRRNESETGGGNFYSRRPPPGYGGGGSASAASRFFDVALRFVTTRSFLLNVAFASVLLGGATLIETSGQTLWKMNNSGKSFEETIESVKKIKGKKGTR